MYFYIGSIITWFLKQRAGQIQSMMEHPLDTQWGVFRYLIQQAAHTEWGIKYDYNSIDSYEDFKERVPITDYDSFKPWIDRMMRGEQNLLWPSHVKWFSKSSGTTSDVSKFIPMTEESIQDNHFKVSIDLLTWYCAQYENSKIFDGKGLILGGSHQINHFNEFSSYGDLSAVLMQNMSFLAQFYRTPDLTIALMDDWEQKIEKLARSTVGENVTNISGVPTWTMMLIKRLFEITGKASLKEIWPSLELYIHGGVSFKPYRSQFQKLINDSSVRYLETYNASEGFFAFQSDWDSNGMLLHLNAGIFYEFIPQHEWNSEHPKTLQLHEVNCDDNYALVISTNNGLWRYRVGDTVRFTSLKPFKIEVSGRVKHYINAFGEEVIVDNTDRAIAETCTLTGARVLDYTAAPVYLTVEERGCHEWLIEFEKEPGDMQSFIRLLDEQLRKVNSDYDAKRAKDIALKAPVIHAVPPQTFYNWLKSKGKLGGQHKVPRLSNTRNYIEEIKSFAFQNKEKLLFQ